jgi:bifunctional non-homologous end joining protein LigD
MPLRTMLEGVGLIFSYERDGAALFKHACKLGLEGIVSKRRDLPYQSGKSKRPAMLRLTEGGSR